MQEEEEERKGGVGGEGELHSHIFLLIRKNLSNKWGILFLLFPFSKKKKRAKYNTQTVKQSMLKMILRSSDNF